MVTVLLVVLLHPRDEKAVSEIIYVPAAVYTWVGFCSELEKPSPKFQIQAMIVVESFRV